MNYGSVCSGIEAATAAWRPLGWRALFLAEVEPFPCAVLGHRLGATRPLRPLDPADAADEKDRKNRESWLRQMKDVPEGGTLPNLGDFTKIQREDYNGDIDLLVGGTPCQSYSIAGLRKGLADPRGNLALEFVRLAYRTGARWTVWENVPGVLSSGAGGDLPASYRCCADGRSPSPRGDGGGAGSSPTPPDATGWLGECWTHSIPEFPCSPAPSPSGGGACSLSDTVAGLSEVLWTGCIPRRYFLTEKCAKGILRRAERRHRELPPLLLAALKRQANEE